MGYDKEAELTAEYNTLLDWLRDNADVAPMAVRHAVAREARRLEKTPIGPRLRAQRDKVNRRHEFLQLRSTMTLGERKALREGPSRKVLRGRMKSDVLMLITAGLLADAGGGRVKRTAKGDQLVAYLDGSREVVA